MIEDTVDINRCRFRELIKWVNNWGVFQDESNNIISYSLEEIINWADAGHKSTNCIIDDLLGSSCLCCSFCVSDNLPKCNLSDRLFGVFK